MNRYQIAIHKSKTGGPHKLILCFPTTMSVNKVKKYIEYCIREKGVLSTANLKTGVVDLALVNISKEYKAPIILQAHTDVQVFKIAQSYKAVYSLENGFDLKPATRVICYDFPASLLPAQVEPLMVVYGRNLLAQESAALTARVAARVKNGV